MRSRRKADRFGAGRRSGDALRRGVEQRAAAVERGVASFAPVGVERNLPRHERRAVRLRIVDGDLVADRALLVPGGEPPRRNRDGEQDDQPQEAFYAFRPWRRYVIRPRVRSYGESSTSTSSPGVMRMRKRRRRPARLARIVWPFSSSTLNVELGNVSTTRPTRLSVSSLATGVRGSRRFLPPPPLRLRGGGMGTPSRGREYVARVRSPLGPDLPAQPRPRSRVPRERPGRAKELPLRAGCREQCHAHQRYRVRNGRSRSRLHLGLRHQPRQVDPANGRSLVIPAPPPQRRDARTASSAPRFARWSRATSRFRCSRSPSRNGRRARRGGGGSARGVALRAARSALEARAVRSWYRIPGFGSLCSPNPGMTRYAGQPHSLGGWARLDPGCGRPSFVGGGGIVRWRTFWRIFGRGGGDFTRIVRSRMAPFALDLC